MVEVKILHSLHSLSWGGLEIYSVELIQKLQEAGFQQKVLCSPSGRVFQELTKLGIETIPFHKPQISKISQTLLIKKLLKEHQFTHLHSHSRLDMWACCLARGRSPSLRHFYNLYMNATPKNDFFHKWLFSHIDALLSSSENILSDVRRNFPIAPEKLHLVRYGRKTEGTTSRPDAREFLRSKFSVQPAQTVFGSLCRIDPGKGVRELVESLELLTDSELAKIQLWIVGDPTIVGTDSATGAPRYAPTSEALDKWVQEKCRSPRLQQSLKRIPFQTQYMDYIAALDVFALAAYNETYSLSVLDAMIMAKPVIGTNSGGTPEQVGENLRGRLVEPQDAKSLAEAFRFYLANPEKITEQGARAQAWVLSQHRWIRVIEQYKNLYSVTSTKA